MITEGELDALLVSQYGVDAITSTGGGSTLAKHLSLFKFKRKVYIATDMDDAGDQAADDLALTWRHTLRCRWWDGKDLTDHLTGLPIEKRADAVRTLIAEAREY